MKKFPLFLLAVLLTSLVAFAQVKVAKQAEYVMYAQFLEDTKVELSDGSVWAMDKGDCFPIYMFKDHQTRVILTLGSATFPTETKRVRVMKDSEKEAAVKSYRVNLENFLKSRADHWKKEAEGKEAKKS